MLLDEIVGDPRFGAEGGTGTVLLNQHRSQTIVEKEWQYQNESYGSRSQQILVRRHYSGYAKQLQNMELPALICRFRDPFPLPLPWPILVRLMHKLCLWCNAVISFITSGHQPPVQNKNTDEPIMEFLLPFHFDSSGYSIIGYPIKKTYHYKLSMITYSILNYEQICKDVTARSRIMLDYRSIVQKRIRIENDYLVRLKQLNLMPEMRKVPSPTKSSQIIYNSLINAIHSEIDNVSNHINRMQTQILKQFSSCCYELENDSKREVMNASILIKDYEKRYEDVERLKFKVIRKGGELKKLKEEYIVGTLVDMPFDKKNKLFIKTKEVQESYKPMREEFDQMMKVFNQKANTTAEKLKQNIKRIQKCELEKVELMKKIFMVLQISNSQFGANLIQDKASILTRLNNLETTNPDFKPSQPQTNDHYKSQMQVHLHDPCSYINNLFTNIVDTKNMQSLVIYGHEARHRESITQGMIENAETQIRADQCKELGFVREIAACFKNIFNEDAEIDEGKVKRLSDLMANSPEGRKNFILCLQKFRTLGKFDISQKKLQPIEQILCTFLDQCMKQLDTYNSKLLLVLSFTYYVFQNEQRVDLHNFIQEHKIWRDKEWWECALLESSYEEIKVKPKKMEEPPITIWHIKGSGLKHSEGEHEMTSQNIFFNQLTFYLHNMRLFEIREEIITYIAKKYVRYFQLSAKIAADIEPFLKIQDVSIEEMESEIVSPTGSSPISLKKKNTSRRLFARNFN